MSKGSSGCSALWCQSCSSKIDVIGGAVHIQTLASLAGRVFRHQAFVLGNLYREEGTKSVRQGGRMVTCAMHVAKSGMALMEQQCTEKEKLGCRTIIKHPTL